MKPMPCLVLYCPELTILGLFCQKHQWVLGLLKARNQDADIAELEQMLDEEFREQAGYKPIAFVCDHGVEMIYGCLDCIFEDNMRRFAEAVWDAGIGGGGEEVTE